MYQRECKELESAMKIVIVGGVAGGATAAARLRRVSETAEIVLVERGPYISFANCGLPYHISGAISEREQLLVTSESLFEARYRVDVRSHTEALSINRVAKTVRLRNLETGAEMDERLRSPALVSWRRGRAAADPRHRLQAHLHLAQYSRSRSHNGSARREPAAPGGGDRRRLHRSRSRGEFP